MSPKHHHPPISGGDRKALTKGLSRSRAMTKIFAERSAEKRRQGEMLIAEADKNLPELERTHVERRRPHRSKPDH
jgi:hypothetical protein